MVRGKRFDKPNSCGMDTAEHLRIQEADLQTHVGDLERQAWLEQVRQKGPFDLIILANCLNEIYIDANDPITAQTALVDGALRVISTAWHNDDRGARLTEDFARTSPGARPITSLRNVARSIVLASTRTAAHL